MKSNIVYKCFIYLFYSKHLLLRMLTDILVTFPGDAALGRVWARYTEASLR